MIPEAMPPSDGLEGRSIIVTGAGGAIGARVVQDALAAGMSVTATDASKERLDAACAAAGGATEVQAVVGDIADLAFQSHLVSEALGGFGQLDALAHVAGVLKRVAAITEITLDDWMYHSDVIERGTFFLVRGVAEQIRKQGTDGAIVCFSSVSAHHGGLGGTWPYAAANAGVLALVRGMGRTYAPHGIRVNGIAPGAVDSPMMTAGLTAEQLEQVLDKIPIGRMAQPSEIASVCLFLLGERASYIAGVTVDVDGAWLTR